MCFFIDYSETLVILILTQLCDLREKMFGLLWVIHCNCKIRNTNPKPLIPLISVCILFCILLWPQVGNPPSFHVLGLQVHAIMPSPTYASLFVKLTIEQLPLNIAHKNTTNVPDLFWEFYFICICVYVSAHVLVYAGVCMSVVTRTHEFIWRPEDNPRCHSSDTFCQCCSYFFMRQDLSVAWNSPCLDFLHWIVWKLPVLFSPVLWLQISTTTPSCFTWNLGMKPRSSCLKDKHLWDWATSQVPLHWEF